MATRVAPRIFCIPAATAPVVAVFRRGPTQWSHLGRWDLAQSRYEPGAWLHGRIFPRRSDLSPDGRWLCYFAHKSSATWPQGETYILQVRRLDAEVSKTIFEEDLALLEPDPTPSPDWAQRW